MKTSPLMAPMGKYEESNKDEFFANAVKDNQSTYGGSLPDNEQCSSLPFTKEESCALLQLVNVHNVSSTLWFGNATGSWVKFPLSFEKKGNYKIKLVCRGSIFYPVAWNSSKELNCRANPFSEMPHFGASIDDVDRFATLTLSGNSSNTLSTKNYITGDDLDRRYCAGSNNEFPCNCRVYTKNADGKVGEIDVYIDAKIYVPGTYDVKVQLNDNGISGAITGFSIHKIEAVWNGVFCGCTDPSALNYDVDVVLDNGTCKYPQPNPPEPVPQPSCNCKLYKHKGVTNGADDYRIYWDIDNNPNDRTDWIDEDDYENKIHEHTYSHSGRYHVKVETRDVIFFLWEKKDWVFDQTIDICPGSKITPILNLLLGD